MTFPVYKQLYSLVSIIGAIRAVVFYIGGHKKPKTVKEMVRDRDPQAFWLDERFDTNPGFLADEGEKQRGEVVAAAQRYSMIKEDKSTHAAPEAPPSVFKASERHRIVYGSVMSSPAMSSRSSMDIDFLPPVTANTAL